jgi:hypothetical protein
MQKHQVRNAADALAYITDCNLATVCHMSMLRSSNKGELARQISIAQFAVNWLVILGADFSATRAYDVVNGYGGSVQEWAEQFKPK